MSKFWTIGEWHAWMHMCRQLIYSQYDANHCLACLEEYITRLYEWWAQINGAAIAGHTDSLYLDECAMMCQYEIKDVSDMITNVKLFLIYGTLQYGYEYTYGLDNQYYTEPDTEVVAKCIAQIVDEPATVLEDELDAEHMEETVVAPVVAPVAAPVMASGAAPAVGTSPQSRDRRRY